MDANTMKLRVEQWMPIFEAQARSGMTKSQWCDENGIRRWEFYERQRECREYMLKTSEPQNQLTALPPQQGFFELPVVSAGETGNEAHNNPSDTNGHICVECGKFRINIDGRINKETLMTLIRAVANA